MKKVSVFCILIAIVALAVVPGTCLAAATSVSDTNLCLINPVAIAVIDNYLFVADNVDNSQSVLLCFEVQDSAPVYKYTSSFSKQIVNLSNANDNLCVIYADSFEIFRMDNGIPKEGEGTVYEMSITDATNGIFTSYVPTETTVDVLYTLNSEGLSYIYNKTSFTPDGPTTEKATACLFVSQREIGEDLGGYTYCVYNNQVKRFNGQNGKWDNNNDLFNKLGVYTPLSLKGLFSYQIGEEWNIALFSDSQMNKLEKKHYGPIDGKEWEYAATEVLPLERAETDGVIVDAEYAANKIFVLNSNNQVEIFCYESESSKFVRASSTIGTDTVSLGALPTSFTGFTLAKSKGYPTNIVYKTSDSATSISTILTDNTEEFVILNFEGAESLPFYYVLVGDKFGWVKKSDGATTPESDSDKIEIVDTKISQDVTYKAKFVSLGAVFIYDLPLTNSNSEAFSQTITAPQDAEILQKFTETCENGTTVEWYYVGYGDGKKGFIQSENVGQFYATSSISDGVKVIGYKKINSSLFEAVKIYLTSDMKESQAICNAQGDAVKLYSGERVVAVREEKGATFVEIRQSNGDVSYGWIDSKCLIDLHGITTNAIVGLSILAVAVVVSAVFIGMFVSRRKKQKSQSSQGSEN